MINSCYVIKTEKFFHGAVFTDRNCIRMITTFELTGLKWLLQTLFFPDVELNERAAALIDGVDTWCEAVGFTFKMWMIRLAATLGKAYGRELLLFLISVVAKLACSDLAVASWLIVLTIIFASLKGLRFVYNQVYVEGDSPPGFWLACIVVLVDSCFAISAWWYVLQAEPASSRAAIVCAWLFVVAASYNAVWLCLRVVLASFLKLRRLAPVNYHDHDHLQLQDQHYY